MQVMKVVGVLCLAVFVGSAQRASASSVSEEPQAHELGINRDWNGDPPGGQLNDNGISYHGGPVMSTDPSFPPTVYLIFYGSWDDNSIALLSDFANGIGGSPYFNINTTYCDFFDCTAGGNPVINNVVYGGASFDSYSLGTNLNNSSMRTIVISAINRDLPVDYNGVYFVLTSADVNNSSGFCTQFCGWHTHTTAFSTDIKYSWVGNPLHCSSTQCMRQRTRSPNDNPGADGVINIVAHELEETVTDPDLNAWYDSRGQENADKCAWTFGTIYDPGNGSMANMSFGDPVAGTLHDYLIQRNWVNASGGYCDVSY